MSVIVKGSCSCLRFGCGSNAGMGFNCKWTTILECEQNSTERLLKCSAVLQNVTNLNIHRLVTVLWNLAVKIFPNNHEVYTKSEQWQTCLFIRLSVFLGHNFISQVHSMASLLTLITVLWGTVPKEPDS